jgi:hypothetical protein
MSRYFEAQRVGVSLAKGEIVIVDLAIFGAAHGEKPRRV